MKEKIMFLIMMFCCYGIFCSLELKKELMLKDPTVRFEERKSPLRGKESLLVIKGL